MDEDEQSLAPLAGGVGAGIGSTVPFLLRVDGLTALAAAASAGALIAATLVVVISISDA
jgi:hypothetical protein